MHKGKRTEEMKAIIETRHEYKTGVADPIR
jgi:hypothetical protein